MGRRYYGNSGSRPYYLRPRGGGQMEVGEYDVPYDSSNNPALKSMDNYMEAREWREGIEKSKQDRAIQQQNAEIRDAEYAQEIANMSEEGYTPGLQKEALSPLSRMGRSTEGISLSTMGERDKAKKAKKLETKIDAEKRLEDTTKRKEKRGEKYKETPEEKHKRTLEVAKVKGKGKSKSPKKVTIDIDDDTKQQFWQKEDADGNVTLKPIGKPVSRFKKKEQKDPEVEALKIYDDLMGVLSVTDTTVEGEGDPPKDDAPITSSEAQSIKNVADLGTYIKGKEAKLEKLGYRLESTSDPYSGAVSYDLLKIEEEAKAGTALPHPEMEPQGNDREKRSGFFGELQRPDGGVSTELSIEVEMNGQRVEIPALVPTLTQKEIDHLLSGGEITEKIVKKAIDHAEKRLAEGKSPFAEEGEQQAPKPQTFSDAHIEATRKALEKKGKKWSNEEIRKKLEGKGLKYKK